MLLSICNDTIETFKILGIIIYIVKILVPIIIIYGGIKDVIGVILKGNDDSVKNSFYSLTKRIIAGFIVFLIPTMIPVLIKMLVGDYENNDLGRCSICLFEPGSNDCEKYIQEYKSGRKQIKFDDVYIDGALDLSDLDEAIEGTYSGSGPISEDSIKGRPNVVGVRERAKGRKAEAFLSAWDNISRGIEEDVKNGIDWRWGGGVNATFKKARRLGNYKTYCGGANYWALKDAGVIPKDKFIYGCKNIEAKNMTEEEVNNAFIIIMGDGRTAGSMIKSGDLIPGDTVYWTNVCHTNAYAGNYLWYDAGRNFTGGHGTPDNYHFNTLGPLRIEFYESQQVYKILRIRED